MKITFDAQVLARVANWTDADLILDFDQTIGENGRPVEGCSIGTNYRLIAIDKGTVPDVFDVIIDSNFAPLHFKAYGRVFLTKDMTLTENPDKRVQLKESGEVIDSNVQVLDFRTQPKA
ncbi:MAG: iron-sulfur cluster biosynthesis family protein [Streptococcaceae bacterium]|nr:iron-sulfur cluster biosynthesis family protein [Streptococcaceae bacterium]